MGQSTGSCGVWTWTVVTHGGGWVLGGGAGRLLGGDDVGLADGGWVLGSGCLLLGRSDSGRMVGSIAGWAIRMSAVGT